MSSNLPLTHAEYKAIDAMLIVTSNVYTNLPLVSDAHDGDDNQHDSLVAARFRRAQPAIDLANTDAVREWLHDYSHTMEMAKISKLEDDVVKESKADGVDLDAELMAELSIKSDEILPPTPASQSALLQSFVAPLSQSERDNIRLREEIDSLTTDPYTAGKVLAKIGIEYKLLLKANAERQINGNINGDDYDQVIGESQSNKKKKKKKPATRASL